MQNSKQISEIVDELLDYIERSRALCFMLKHRMRKAGGVHLSESNAVKISERMPNLPTLPIINDVTNYEERRKVVLQWLEEVRNVREEHSPAFLNRDEPDDVLLNGIERDLVRIGSEILMLREGLSDRV